jgi:hypothetical protein
LEAPGFFGSFRPALLSLDEIDTQASNYVAPAPPEECGSGPSRTGGYPVQIGPFSQY